MSRPRLLDLFCCAGGAGMGYHRAGFDVVGVDINPQPNYPFDFVQADAIAYLAAHGHEFDAIHTSPPCQANSAMTKGNRARGWVDDHVDLIPVTRALLDHVGRPYVIENVQGSSLRRDVTLCGEMFGLSVIRHRYFELGAWTATAPQHQPHRGRVAGYRHGSWYQGPYFAVYGDGGGKGTVQQWQQAMGIDWTTIRRELSEAIPPRLHRAPRRTAPRTTRAGRRMTSRVRARRWEDLQEDVDELARQGCSAAEICRRLETTVYAVQRAYYRHGTPMPAPFRIDTGRKFG